MCMCVCVCVHEDYYLLPPPFRTSQLPRSLSFFLLLVLWLCVCVNLSVFSVKKKERKKETLSMEQWDTNSLFNPINPLPRKKGKNNLTRQSNKRVPVKYIRLLQRYDTTHFIPLFSIKNYLLRIAKQAKRNQN